MTGIGVMGKMRREPMGEMAAGLTRAQESIRTYHLDTLAPKLILRSGAESLPFRNLEGVFSPASRSTKKEGLDSTSRSTKEEAVSSAYSASNSTKEESYPPGPRSINETSSSSRSTTTNGEYWTPKSRSPGHTRSRVMENGTDSEEDHGSGPIAGCAVERLSRPGHGTAGYEVNLQTNCFEVKLDARVQLYQYHVHVMPEPKTARQRKQAFDIFLNNASFLNRLRLDGQPPVVATDYRSTLITTERLDPQASKEDDRHQCIVTYHEAEEDAPKKNPSIHSHIFTVSFCQPLPLQKLTQYLGSTGGQALSKVNGSILHALSLVVARKPLKLTDIARTKNEHRFFPDAEPLAVLDGALVALQGFQATVRIMGPRLFINVNPRTGIFYRENKEGTLLDLMYEFRRTSQGMEQMQEFVKGIRVSLAHLSSERGKLKIKTVSGLASHPTLGANTMEASFRWKDRDVTVADYYKQSKQI